MYENNLICIHFKPFVGVYYKFMQEMKNVIKVRTRNNLNQQFILNFDKTETENMFKEVNII